MMERRGVQLLHSASPSARHRSRMRELDRQRQGCRRRGLLAHVPVEPSWSSDTQANNGVLLYLLLADHRIEIVADRGFDGKVGAGQWRGVCERVEQGMRAGDREAAVIAGITALLELIVPHFPRGIDHINRNELSDLTRML